MKRAIWNVLGVAGLLLMFASLVWISFHQEKRPAVYRESKATQPQTSKPFAVVVLDPGHGGQDSGAMCGGVMEKDLTLDVARRVDRLLDSEGVATLMTRLGDSYVSLADRAAFGNRATDSIFISIHFNE
jgi:N-acetylmuramoyl-L-alanine amidase